jgi:protein ImuB
MAFASLFVPNFSVQATVRAQPELAARPLILVEGPHTTVVGLNEPAAKAGVRLGMTKSQARQLGEMEVRERSGAQEKIAHAALLDLGWSFSPRIEATTLDTVVLDIAGLAGLLGSEDKIALDLARGAWQLGLKAQVATAANVDAALLAARGFRGVTVIPAGSESATIGKVAVSILAASNEILETLDRWGVHTCGQLAALPVLRLSERLGQEGVRLHELAQGRSLRAMVLAQPAINFEEAMELEDAVAEIEPLSFLLGRLLSQLCARLTARALAACLIRVRFQLEPSSEKESIRLKGDSRQRAVPMVYEKVLTLPVPLRDAQTLLKLLVLNLQSDPPSAPIVKIFLSAEAARPQVLQGGLFSPISPDPEKLELTVARLAKIVGEANLGSPELLDTHRREGFRMRRFSPQRNLPEAHRGVRQREKHQQLFMEEAEKPGLKTAFRVFRPALPARVEVRRGCPAWIAFAGMSGPVIKASGPWRGSGEWWKEDDWQNDEWDIEIQSNTPLPSQVEGMGTGRRRDKEIQTYRLLYDSARQAWFVCGAYD